MNPWWIWLLKDLPRVLTKKKQFNLMKKETLKNTYKHDFTRLELWIIITIPKAAKNPRLYHGVIYRRSHPRTPCSHVIPINRNLSKETQGSVHNCHGTAHLHGNSTLGTPLLFQSHNPSPLNLRKLAFLPILDNNSWQLKSTHNLSEPA